MDAGGALVTVLREEGPRVLATLVRHLGDLPVAEDALSEATIAALLVSRLLDVRSGPA
jgi:RNA polymerase sigma-70 factor (ECF subfamily)